MRTTTDLRQSALAHVSRLIDATLQSYLDGHTEALRALCSPDLTVFGTAAHEKTHTVEEFLRLLPTTPVSSIEDTSWRFISAEAFIEDRISWVWGEVAARLKTGGAWIDMPPIRTTWILRRIDAAASPDVSWEIVHFHSSFPDQQRPDEFLDMDELQAHSRMLAEKVAERTAELERSLDELRRTQAQLIQQEKLASLGALTAGIAHEIKNPLNFVNNFASLSRELVEEIKTERSHKPELRVAEVEDVLMDLEANVARIEEHGKRADGIIKSMLAHARGSTGNKETLEVNRIVSEYADLAFHAARAQRPDLELTLEKTLDPDAGAVEGLPQDLSRVLVNLVQNAFQAVDARRRAGTSGDGAPAEFTPSVRVSTHATRDQVEIRVWDNGGGIPEDIRSRIFEPFFTTKPTGEGTGLGLSLSHDIVSAHGGTLTVETSQTDGTTTFTVRLPRQAPVEASLPAS